jgi:hypothetical protein
MILNDLRHKSATQRKTPKDLLLAKKTFKKPSKSTHFEVESILLLPRIKPRELYHV